MENTYWDETNLNSQVKLENTITYSGAGNSEDDEYGYHGNKKKLARDPLSHRIIEKRRRDRMNSCLADLSRLIPHEYMKKGRGRVEKTEVIEMAIRRIKHLMNHTSCNDSECGQEEKKLESEESHRVASNSASIGSQQQIQDQTEQLATSYRLGFVECLSETIHFLVQVEGLMATDPFCSQLKSHLSNHCDNILHSESLRSRLGFSSNIVKTEPCTNPPQNELANTFDSHEQRVAHYNCTQDTGSDTSTGHTNNLSPTSSHSEKGQGMVIDSMPSYKFKNRIRKRFEKGGAGPSRIIVDKSSRVPVFVLAPGGAHYLATWLEAASIPGYIKLNSICEPQTSLAHHPVTISVDFRPKVGIT